MPKHDFVLEDRAAALGSSYQSFSWDSNGKISREGLLEEEFLSFDDEFVLYVYDYLKWLPTWNPSTKKYGNGLNLYGVTTIEGTSLPTLRRMVHAWIDLFELAPENIVLTGSYILGNDELSGQYERLEYNKRELIGKLNQLSKMIDRAISEDKCILHLGI